MAWDKYHSVYYYLLLLSVLPIIIAWLLIHCSIVQYVYDFAMEYDWNANLIGDHDMSDDGNANYRNNAGSFKNDANVGNVGVGGGPGGNGGGVQNSEANVDYHQEAGKLFDELSKHIDKMKTSFHYEMTFMRTQIAFLEYQLQIFESFKFDDNDANNNDANNANGNGGGGGNGSVDPPVMINAKTLTMNLQNTQRQFAEVLSRMELLKIAFQHELNAFHNRIANLESQLEIFTEIKDVDNPGDHNNNDDGADNNDDEDVSVEVE